MRKLFKTGLLATIALVAMLAVTSYVYAYIYRVQVAITENASGSYTMLSVLWPQNNDWLADNGFIESDALDTRVQTMGGLNKPHLVTENQTLTATAVPANSQTNLYFVTGETDLDAMDIMTGYEGYITVTDAANIEFGDNFTLAIKGLFLDTDNGTDKNIIHKEKAYRIFDHETAAGNITAITFGTPTTVELLVNGDGDYTNIQNKTAATHWQSVDDAHAAPDDASYVSEARAAQYKDAFELEDASGTIGVYDIVDNVTVYYRFRSVVANMWGQPFLRLDGVETDGTEVQRVADGFGTYSETLDRPGGGDWSLNDIDDLQVVLGLRATGADTVYGSQISVVVSYTPVDVEVSATGIDSDEHDLVFAEDNPFYALGIDAGTDILPVTDNLIYNAPLPQTECDADPFTSIDDYGHSSNVDTAVWTSLGYDFTNASDDITVTAANSFNSTAYTYIAWVKLTDPAPSRYMWAVAFDNATGTERLDLIAYKYNDGSKRYGVYSTGTGGFIYASSSPGLGTWRQIAFTADNSTGAYAFYLDGQPDGSGTSAGLVPTWSVNPTLRLGNWAGDNNGLDGLLGEVKVYSDVLTPAEILKDYNATKSKYTSGDIYTYSSTSNITDNSNDIILFENNTVVYSDNLTLDIDGTRQMWFEPNDMISGTTLPDRQGADNDGDITWGSNPAGVYVSLGSMESSGQTTIGSTADRSTADLLPEAGGTEWDTPPDVAGSLLTNPFRPIVTAVSDNTTLSERQVWVWYGIILVVFVTMVTAAVVKGHHVITGIACGATIVFLVVQTVFPLFALIFTVVTVVSGVLLERKPSI